MAQRTVYSIYSTVSALFRDAKLADKIEQTPCCLDERQLGPLVDKNPEWRATAIFSRDEVETLISHPEIPLDRRIVYALELLAGVRTGEAAALRWRHYDPTKQPLGELLVAFSYSTLRSCEKTTKTDSSKHIPVHPTLAAMLAEWKLGGWAAMMGRHPEPDDLVVPMPPEHAARRRTRTGEAFRAHDYSGERWRRDDLPALGWAASPALRYAGHLHHACSRGRGRSACHRNPRDSHEEAAIGVRRLQPGHAVGADVRRGRQAQDLAPAGGPGQGDRAAGRGGRRGRRNRRFRRLPVQWSLQRTQRRGIAREDCSPTPGAQASRPGLHGGGVRVLRAARAGRGYRSRRRPGLQSTILSVRVSRNRASRW